MAAVEDGLIADSQLHSCSDSPVLRAAILETPSPTREPDDPAGGASGTTPGEGWLGLSRSRRAALRLLARLPPGASRTGVVGAPLVHSVRGNCLFDIMH